MLGCATWAQLEAESSCIGHMRTKYRRVVDFEEFNCNALELQLTLNLSSRVKRRGSRGKDLEGR